MGDWLLGLPVLAMGAIILGLTYLGTAAIYWVITRLAENERTRAAFKAGAWMPPFGRPARPAS